jgi:hypothetical protein
MSRMGQLTRIEELS